MFKPSRKAILFVTVLFIAAAALPGIALAKQGGNGHNNGSSGSSSTSNTQGGGPPACRDLQGTIDQLQTMINSLSTSIATINANVNNINTNVTTLSGRIDTINSTLATVNANLDTFSARFDAITTTLSTLQTDIENIQATLQAQGVGGLQASVGVNTTACTVGASQCSSTAAAGSTNQNPVALNVLVTNGSTPISTLTSSNFVFSVPFAPNGQPMTFAVCTNGDTGCGTGTFFVNTGNGAYQLWVSPASNWMPGTYSGLLTITNTTGQTTVQQVDFTIPQ